jgi:two-component system, OmpR family, sensor kinase
MTAPQGRPRHIKLYVGDPAALASAISHDLRTPLARIRFKLEAEPPDKASILSDVTQMEQMITALLMFIRGTGEGGRRERLDLLSVIECAVDEAARRGGEVRIEASAPLLVDADATALQRLFANLIDYAL